MTVKVQGILVTCIHLPYCQGKGGELGRIKEIKRIWEVLKGLWKEGDAKHIFAGDFNSLTWQDLDEEEWSRVAEERATKNLLFDKAISLSEKKQELLKGLGPEVKAELDKVETQLVSSLESLSIKPRAPISKLISHLEFKRQEEPKFELTKLIKDKGFIDLWEEVEKKLVGEFGQSGSQTTSK